MSCVLSVLIVHYNSAEMLRRCLGSVFSGAAGFPFEVVVIDNASSEPGLGNLARDFSQVRFHFNGENQGFARASNQGIRLGGGQYLLLLNPDALIDGGGMGRMVEFMEGCPDAGAAAPRLLYPDGRLQFSCRRFPSRCTLLIRMSRLDWLFPRPVRRYLMQEWDHQGVRAVDWVMGACMMVRREAVEAVGLLDEGFFMYYEDMDLCYRLWQAGWRVYYNPEVAVRHEHQRLSASGFPNRMSWEHARSLCHLFRKHPLPWC